MLGDNLHNTNDGNSEQQIPSPTVHTATAVGTLVFGGPGRGHQRLDETTHERRQGLERLLALLVSRGLACLCGSLISLIIGHHPPASGVFRLCGFPEIHTRARYFKALVLIEDPLYVLGTGHVHDPEA
jgi:hypothetical protein